jgi:EAL domain-containing protein (putative c-di-GMP-specific phosphodiesterase class I)
MRQMPAAAINMFCFRPKFPAGRDRARDSGGPVQRDAARRISHSLSAAVLRDGGVAGFEALLRWKHPVHGLIPPAEFISLAKQAGLILRLGDWVLAEASPICRTWQEPGQRRVSIAVNVSAVQFDVPEYPERVFAILAETGIDPSLVTLELTEGILVRDAARTRANLTRLHLARVWIALDDFGTGYSSSSYLTDLPADVIKLDHRFVNNLHPERRLLSNRWSSLLIDSACRLLLKQLKPFFRETLCSV